MTPDGSPPKAPKARIEARAEAEVARAVERFAQAARGMAPRLCPLCGLRARFTAFGHPPRFDARCPGCGALERHRLFALWVARQEPFAATQAVLHFAPEAQLTALIRPLVATYDTADLSERRPVTHRVDICDTGLPGVSYDRIVCNHVLEHVDDRRALREMSRLLKPGGLAVISTPVVEGWATTYEDATVTAPADRRLHFGQADHLRVYGRDVRDRIRAAGFRLDEFTALEPDVRVHGLMRGETLFLAHKEG